MFGVDAPNRELIVRDSFNPCLASTALRSIETVGISLKRDRKSEGPNRDRPELPAICGSSPLMTDRFRTSGYAWVTRE